MKTRPKNLKSISVYPEENEYMMNCFSLLYIEDIDTDWQGGYLLYKLKLLRWLIILFYIIILLIIKCINI